MPELARRSRWCDQSILDERNPGFSVALYKVVIVYGTLVAETILASVRVRAHQQAEHMDASDLIKALQNTLRGGARPHMENGVLAYLFQFDRNER